MSDRLEAIMDSAERHIRLAGYSGFSFRDIAADVGIRSPSIHHHYATKEDLAVAVARRYVERFEQAVADEEASGAHRVEAWRRVFRRAALEDGRMCLCGALGMASADLPPAVAQEARRFFERGLESLSGAKGVSRSQAMQVLASLEGAMLLATILGDPASFDQAVGNLTPP